MWNLWKSSPEKQMVRKIVECTYNGTLRWERQDAEYFLFYQADGGKIKFAWSPGLCVYKLSIDGVIVCKSYTLLFEVYWAIHHCNPLKNETIQRFLERFI